MTKLTVKAPTGSPEEKTLQSIARPGGELAAFLATVAKSNPTVVRLAKDILNPPRIPSGVFELDYATGGGFPQGRIIIIYGPEAAGKTTMTFGVIANTQKLPVKANKAVFVDIEGTLDTKFAAQHGVDIDSLIVVNPDYGEMAVDMICAMAALDEVGLIVVDSLAALVPIAENEKSTEKADVGGNSVLVKRLVNRLAQAQSIEARRNHFPTIVFINQTRLKIGVMFGNPETTPGGNAPRFMASMIIRVESKDVFVKEYSSELPTMKALKVDIKKAKVPINTKHIEYQQCVLAHDVLTVGQSASFQTVEAHLKAHGLLVKEPTAKGGYIAGGVRRRTLKDMAMAYYTEPQVRTILQGLVIEASARQAFVPNDPNEKEVVKPGEEEDALAAEGLLDNA